MKDLMTSALLAATVMSASVAHAGGPVIIEEGNDELIAEKPASTIGILPVLGALVLVCLIACGGGDDEDPGTTPGTTETEVK
jgi:hypothetical protein